MISEFRREHSFLSNFYLSPIEFEGAIYKTVEHAYQAAKTMNPIQRNQIRLVSKPGVAKRFGQLVDIRPDWDKIKLGVMYQLLQKKFEDPVLRKRLLATGDEELVEGNWWGDDFWGVPQGPLYKGVGQNHLGKLLMKVREEIRAQHV